MNLSYTEENYLKALYKIGMNNHHQGVGTKDLATHLKVKPSSANEMIKRLKDKKLIVQQRYRKIFLTTTGYNASVMILRKHRLWETFLYNILKFDWDEIHEVAEELEHIHSEKLINSLDLFLGYPKYDPHGNPIPNRHGRFEDAHEITLSETEIGSACRMVGTKDSGKQFFEYLSKIGLAIGSTINVINREPFDGMMQIKVDGKNITISKQASDNIVIK